MGKNKEKDNDVIKFRKKVDIDIEEKAEDTCELEVCKNGGIK